MKKITCKGAITDGNGNFSIEDITVDHPHSDELLVQIKAAGLCHTDYDSMRWGEPLVMGHEGAGVIVEVGSAVTDFKIGDEVILNWATPCGNCFQCLHGNLHLCEKASAVTAGNTQYTAGHAHLSGTLWQNQPIKRSFNIGTLSEYTLVKSSAAVKKTASQMPFSTASIISCSVMTGYGSVVNAANVKPGTSVVVLGVGGVGLNVIQAAHISGAAQIIAIDINSNRLETAKKFGATHTLIPTKNDSDLTETAQKVKTLTDGRGADYAFECTAIPALGAAPLAMVRNAGTAVQVSGIEQEITIDMNLFEWDKIYMNPLYGKCNPQIDFPKIMALYEKETLKLNEMVTNTYPLSDLQHALEDMLSGKNIKGVITF